MRETTKKRYERIRQAAAHMYGKMPVMKLYVALGEDFGMSDEQISSYGLQAKKRIEDFYRWDDIVSQYQYLFHKESAACGKVEK